MNRSKINDIIDMWISFMDREEMSRLRLKEATLANSITIQENRITDNAIQLAPTETARLKEILKQRPNAQLHLLIPVVEFAYGPRKEILPIAAMKISAIPDDGLLSFNLTDHDSFWVVKETISMTFYKEDEELGNIYLREGFSKFVESLVGIIPSSLENGFASLKKELDGQVIQNGSKKRILPGAVIAEITLGDFSANLRREFDELKKMDVPKDGVLAEYLFGTEPIATTVSPWQGQLDEKVVYGKGQAEVLKRLHTDEKLIAVQGPPGTGKTTLITGVIASAICWRATAIAAGQKKTHCQIVVASDTGKAVTNVLESLNKRFGECNWLVFEGGNREKMNAELEKIDRLMEELKFEAFEQTEYDRLAARLLARAQGAATKQAEIKKDTERATLLKDRLVQLQQEVTRAAQAVEQNELLLATTDANVPLDGEALKQLKWQIEAVLAEIENGGLIDRMKQFFGSNKAQQKVNELIQNNLVAFGKIMGRIPRTTEELSPIPNLIEGFLQELEAQHEVLASLEKSRKGLGRVKKELNVVEREEEILATKLGLMPDFYEALRTTKESRTDLSQNLDDATAFLRQEILRRKEEVMTSLILYRQGKWAEFRRDLVGNMANLSLAFPVMGTTLNSVRNLIPFLAEGCISLGIIDEAGQVPAHKLAPFLARCKKAIVVGDPKQLSPVISLVGQQAEEYHDAWVAKGFGEEEIDRWSPMSATAYHRAARCNRPLLDGVGKAFFLDEHRRCAPEIAGLFAQIADYRRLEVKTSFTGIAADTPEGSVEKVVAEQFAGARVVGFQVDAAGQGTHNDGEAAAVAAIVNDLAAAGVDVAKMVGIVTPFRMQMEILRRKVKNIPKDHIGTVHVFQGGEFPIMIFSPSVSRVDQANAGFIDATPNMLNVAISRAKQLLIVAGNLHVMHTRGGRLGMVVDYIKEKGLIVDTPAPAPTIEHVKNSSTRIIESLEHIELFREALAQAKESLIISTPWIRGDAAREFIDALPGLLERGVAVKVVYGYDREGGSNDNNDVALVGEMKAILGNSLVHAANGTHEKVLIVDRAVMALGSFNWISHSYNKKALAGGAKALGARRETSIVTNDKEVVTEMVRRIERIGK